LVWPGQIPYFNAPIFLENKTQIGKVEEILGSVNNVVRRGKYRCVIGWLAGLPAG
jgi:rRNA processing protein Gar1